MKKTIAGILFAAIAMTGSAALAESTVVEAQKRLEQAFAADDLAERQVSRSNDNLISRTFGGVSFSFIGDDTISPTNDWGNNYRGGRVHGPAGR